MNIKISDLKKNFGNKTAVDINELNIYDGNILGLVGNNGAGKTTLFRIILDLIKQDSGNVTMTLRNKQKEFVPSLSEDWKIYTGAYIDEGFLIDFLTPEEYFQFIGKVNDIAPDEIEARLKNFEQFMNGEILGQKKLIRNFSAGNKQKIGIISALLNNPELVVLDEPFNFLDPTGQYCLKNLLRDYNKNTGATILVGSHTHNNTVDISSRIVVLENGAVIKDLQTMDANAKTELEEYFDI